MPGSSEPEDVYNFQRFLEAQNPVFEQVLAELHAGSKQSHWMWFIFPQMRGLGSSAMAARFAIGSAEEARAYLAHPVLGERLRTCTSAVLGVQGRDADQIFGFPDNLKFHSSVTLFAAVAENDRMFSQALEKYFSGRPDAKTLTLLHTSG